jgi:CRISPR-associated endonuclease/helicase Cas3
MAVLFLCSIISFMEEILAKKNPNESLVSHTESVLKVWDILFMQLKETLPNPEFWKLSFISVLLHDIGKVSLNFQDMMHGRVNTFDNYIRHELYSGSFILLNDKKRFTLSPLPVLSVFSHHKSLVEDIFDNVNVYVDVLFNKELFDFTVNYYQQKLVERGIKFEFDQKVILQLSGKIPLHRYIRTFKDYLLNTSVIFDENTRKEYIRYKAILNTCDWLGSAHKVPDKGMTFSIENLKSQIISKLRDDGKTKIADGFQFREFQLKGIDQQNVIAIAPTGSGKTEAALLWASQKKSLERIIYLLPTRVTSNAIHKRVQTYFDNTDVAIVHSSALFYRKETNENYDQKEYLKDKTFFQNVNVCTIDQVLTQGFNLGYWELKTFHMMNAWVVIDEIHLYAPYTLALIISTIGYLKREFGARFFIMSATMPKKLKQLLGKTLGEEDYKFIQDKELLDKARNIFETRDFYIDDLLEEIRSEIESEKKVLVVVNTVDEAIRIYNELKDSASKAFCYHSRFMQKDRIDKEAEILKAENSGRSLLLVATQVVEVSLDIDFDILFSENAPIDSIVQRAGRVNRKREKENTKVIVFKESEITRKWVYDVPDILDNTFNSLQGHDGDSPTEMQLLKMVDEVYKNIEIETNEHFIDGKGKYKEIQRNLHFIKDNINKDDVYTREGLNTISVIPMENSCTKEGKKEIYFSSDFSRKEAFEKAKHELSVRKSKQYKYRIEKDSKGFNYIDAYYNYELGLVFRQEPVFSIL